MSTITLRRESGMWVADYSAAPADKRLPGDGTPGATSEDA